MRSQGCLGMTSISARTFLAGCASFVVDIFGGCYFPSDSWGFLSGSFTDL